MINSRTTGDPARHLPLDALEAGLRALASPTDLGAVTLVMARGEGGVRTLPASVMVGRDAGVPGDAWGRDPEREIDAQIAVMQTAVARLIANGQPIELSGDQLYLDLDLSAANLPTGSRLRVGEAVLEVTPQPHNGCVKFRGRFGDAALRFVSMKSIRHRNLRGIYLRVVEEGRIAPGDPVRVVHRPAAYPPQPDPVPGA